MPQLENKLTSAGGTTATIEYFDDSDTHDSSYFTFFVKIRFEDPMLNPPNQDGWDCGCFTSHCSSNDIKEKVLKLAQEMFDFLMNFRTLYGSEEAVNMYRDLVREQKEQLNRQEIELRKALFRADEAERKSDTEYIKRLENQLSELKNIIGDYATKFVKTAEKMVNETGANVKNDR